MNGRGSGDVNKPELTFKAVLLGVLLAVLLSSANAYLGLYAGMTVSASIPAAVLSMVILRFFRRSNVLENNLVQTAASAGEAVAAGAIFTLPALILTGAWENLGYWEGTVLVASAGLLGVLFSVPLRRALILETDLSFPEGIATAQVLESGMGSDKSGSGSDRSVLRLFQAGLLGGALKFAQAGMNFWAGTVQGGIRFAGTLFSAGGSLSPALFGVGYIVGIRIASMVALGGVLAWGFGIPLWGYVYGVPEGPAFAVAMELWGQKIRYVGVGAMIFGGLWSLGSLYRPILEAVNSGVRAYSIWVEGNRSTLDQAERDLPLPFLIPVLLLLIGVFFFLTQTFLTITTATIIVVALILFFAFVFSAVAGYMAGLVGSSNNPVSGVTIATILGLSLLLLFMLGSDHPGAATAAILCGAMVACAAAISGDTMQDLKAGHLVGATPWKQQIMEVVGVLSAAPVVLPVIALLNKRYGIGPPTATQPDSLAAPQATLMASVADGVFSDGLPWVLIGVGILVALAVVVFDWFLKRWTDRWSAPVLAVAVGLYLPIQLSLTIFFGGVIAWLCHGTVNRDESSSADPGVLTASGLITGEALVGILLALPVVLSAFHPAVYAGMFEVFDDPPSWGTLAGVVLMGFVGWVLYRSGGSGVSR